MPKSTYSFVSKQSLESWKLNVALYNFDFVCDCVCDFDSEHEFLGLLSKILECSVNHIWSHPMSRGQVTVNICTFQVSNFIHCSLLSDFCINIVSWYIIYAQEDK